MEYKDIINDNCSNHCKVNWWPKFAFHYTDVTNAAHILSLGFLFSRLDATQLGVMNNDNASKQVIDMTKSDITSRVRLYFRPLTPTQYYNEGYKHPSLRYQKDKNANVPVPVFFLFNLGKILNIPGVQFSETTQAGNGSELYSGVEEFSKLNFDYIYDNKYESFELTKNYRHAEIVLKNSLNIEPYLERILCRNELEKATLLNLLKEKNKYAYNKYKNKIGVFQNNIFKNNGLYLNDCSYHKNVISLSFTDTYEYTYYLKHMMEKYGLKNLDPINIKIEIIWKNNENIIQNGYANSNIDPLNLPRITVKVPNIDHANIMEIKVYFEDKLMCFVEQPLEFSEVIK